jgi:peptidoglycan/LPS O-acetylase OafA/YrhL
VKAFAILSVVTIHSVSIAFLLDWKMQFYVWQSVPLFIICTGLVWYLSFNRHSTGLKNTYSSNYFKVKISRFVLPFLFIVLIDLTYINFSGGTLNVRNFVSRIELMQPPISGGGDYYLAFILELILVAPLICYCFNKRSFLTVTGLFIADLAFELAGPYMALDTYYFSVVRFFGAFALGLVLAHNIIKNDGWRFKTKTNALLIILGSASAAFIFFNAGKPTPLFRPEWLTMNLYSYFYPALLVIATLSIGPLMGKYGRAVWGKLAVLGKASYHIFLVQIVFFSPVLISLKLYFSWEGWLIPFNLTLCLAWGLLFYYGDCWIRGCYAKFKAKLMKNCSIN